MASSQEMNLIGRQKDIFLISMWATFGDRDIKNAGSKSNTFIILSLIKSVALLILLLGGMLIKNMHVV